jgi:hypothetical protein
MDPISLGLMGIGAVAKGAGAVGSYFQQRKAQRQLDELGRQPLPMYSVNPAIARLYSGAVGEVARPEGYSGAERGMFQQNLARGLNTQAYNARSMGGGSMSRAISGVLAGNQLNQLNQFAAQDAGLARQNRNAAYSRLMGAANTMQGIGNQNTSMLANRRLRQEELLGQAIASQRAYRTNALNSLGSDLTTAGTYGLMGGGFGGGGEKTTGAQGSLPFGINPYTSGSTGMEGYKLGDMARQDAIKNRNKMSGFGAYNNQFARPTAPFAPYNSGMPDSNPDFLRYLRGSLTPSGRRPSNANPFAGDAYDAMGALDDGSLSTGFYRR